ncbi:hypothetical protein [Glycomyces harbinensis]|nr:hypothetical protein [Glycomyces harbinensis]
MELFEIWALPRVAVFAVAVAAVVFALRTERPTAGQIAWYVAFLSWGATLCMGGGGEGTAAAVVGFAVMALPAVALVLASWLLPRGRSDTVTAETGLLVCIAASMWAAGFSYSYDNSGETAPVELLVWFLFLAAAFVAAAIPLPSRRIAYGAAALTCVVLGVFREWLLWSETGQHPDIPFNDDYLVAAVYVGIPLIGVALQLLWWARRRRRG